MLGLFFDNLFSTKKLFLFIFLFLGTASGLYNGVRYILKEIEKYEREEEKERKSAREGKENSSDGK
ncbi:MAG: AtpZ/AtpI family protein [Fervidobacterium sp.]